MEDHRGIGGEGGFRFCTRFARILCKVAWFLTAPPNPAEEDYQCEAGARKERNVFGTLPEMGQSSYCMETRAMGSCRDLMKTPMLLNLERVCNM